MALNCYIDIYTIVRLVIMRLDCSSFENIQEEEFGLNGDYDP